MASSCERTVKLGPRRVELGASSHGNSEIHKYAQIGQMKCHNNGNSVNIWWLGVFDWVVGEGPIIGSPGIFSPGVGYHGKLMHP